MIGILCVLAAAICLIEARRTRVRILSRPDNDEWALLWTKVNLQSKFCVFIVTLIGLAWGIDRIGLLVNNQITTPVRFLVYGVLRVAMVSLPAGAAWNNSRIFRQMRDSAIDDGK